jgi:hypothetical protein
VNAALNLTVGMARSWVTLYTLRLPLEIRESRRSEIDSDLWEQQGLAARRSDPALGTAIEVLSRMLLGIFDDLIWRLEAGVSVTKGQISVNDTWPMRIGFIALMVPLMLLVANGLGMMMGNGEFDNAQEQVLWGLSFLVAPLVAAVGLWLCRTRPKLGLGLVVGGALSTALLMFWMAFITVPLAIVVIAFAIKRSGLAIWPFRPGTPRAA